MKKEQPIINSLLFKCPACGEGKLYDSFMKITEKCPACGLEIKKHESADGPAYIAMFLTSIIVIIAAISVEVIYRPEFWIHIIIWSFFTVFIGITSLIFCKALFIGLQYKYRSDDFK